MRTLVAATSSASFIQEVALAFHERNALSAFVTSYVYREEGATARLLRTLPSSARSKIEAQMKRRRISALPLDVVETRPFWEIMRVLCTKTGGGAAMADRIWDHMSFDFTRHVARRITRSVGAVYAYEYGALEAFVAAEKHGIARILDFPSLNGREFEEQQRREKDLYPELKDADEEYFAARFERRQARRDEEMARADVIITNSHITRESHIAGGADPDKIFAVPLGAPLPIERVRARPLDGPLKIVWAGTFSIRKGAHHFLEAWRSVGKSGAATADIYGALALPDRIRRSTPSGVSFHGSIPHSSLLDVFETADILVFPTLSDGFGMVITEAFSRGLPVITTTRAGASDLVEHEKNGLLIPAGDPKAIARSLEWCLENRERLAQMRQAALQTARGWQWSDYRRALIDVVSIGLTRAGYQPEFAAQPCIEA